MTHQTSQARREPTLWHEPLGSAGSADAGRRVVIGRQGIYTATGDLFGYELLFCSPVAQVRVDLWDAADQDRATEHVIAAAFHMPQAEPIGALAFVNFTHTFLLGRPYIGFSPDQAVIEVVESAFATRDLSRRLDDLRTQGYRVAIDDFVGTDSQIDLLEHADFIKIDVRDLAALGPELVALASQAGVPLIAERVETADVLDTCAQMGFTLIQGHVFERAQVIERGLAA
ncbi:EAL and HDOD domain-containing protein [Demequina sp.]|uniref:EAL and HDOD domain-containing protein n=1 Tax=Demequina sp. TaxID=2050685 RepID=UPI003A86F7F8